MPARRSAPTRTSALPGPAPICAGIASRCGTSAHASERAPASVVASSSAIAAITTAISTPAIAAIRTTTAVGAAERAATTVETASASAVKTTTASPTVTTPMLGNNGCRGTNQAGRGDSGENSLQQGGFPHVITLHPKRRLSARGGQTASLNLTLLEAHPSTKGCSAAGRNRRGSCGAWAQSCFFDPWRAAENVVKRGASVAERRF